MPAFDPRKTASCVAAYSASDAKLDKNGVLTIKDSSPKVNRLAKLNRRFNKGIIP